MHFDTKKLTRCALIAAIYVALTMLSNALNLAYGPIQLRFSEAMTVLPFLMPEASWGLFIGCVLSKDRKSTRLNSSHREKSRMPSSA